jgi:hypothetical protein
MSLVVADLGCTKRTLVLRSWPVFMPANGAPCQGKPLALLFTAISSSPPWRSLSFWIRSAGAAYWALRHCPCSPSTCGCHIAR